MNIPRYLQVKVMCKCCSHSWPQVLNQHLDDIECFLCNEKGVTVIDINEKDVIRWQSDMENIEHTYTTINEEILKELQDLEVLV